VQYCIVLYRLLYRTSKVEYKRTGKKENIHIIKMIGITGYTKFISCLNLSSDDVSMTFAGKLFHSLIDDGKKECR